MTREYWCLVFALTFVVHNIVCIAATMTVPAAGAFVSCIHAHPMLRYFFIMLVPMIIDIYILDAGEAWA